MGLVAQQVQGAAAGGAPDVAEAAAEAVAGTPTVETRLLWPCLMAIATLDQSTIVASDNVFRGVVQR